MPTFAARRSYRPNAIVSGIGFLLACGALAIAFAVNGATDLAPMFAGLGAVGYFISTIVAIIPAKVSLGLSGKTLTWWRRPLDIDRIELSSWVIPGIDAEMGLAVTVSGATGRIRIGGEGHDGEGYQATGRPQRTVDCHLPKADFDALLAALGVDHGEPGPLVVPLVRNGQTLGGTLRTITPWLVVMGILVGFGLLIGYTEWGAHLSGSEDGQLAMGIGAGALAVIAVGYIVIRGRRVRMPELELRFSDAALIINDQPTPWSAVTIEKRTYSVSSRVGTYAMPVLVLGIGDAKLRLGAWDTQLAWHGSPDKTWRGPHWLVAAAKWPKLVDELRRHGRR